MFYLFTVILWWLEIRFYGVAKCELTQGGLKGELKKIKWYNSSNVIHKCWHCSWRLWFLAFGHPFCLPSSLYSNFTGSRKRCVFSKAITNGYFHYSGRLSFLRLLHQRFKDIDTLLSILVFLLKSEKSMATKHGLSKFKAWH